MKKRILSLLLAILMVVSILPAPTQAADVETTSDSGSVLHKLVKVKSDFNGTAYTTPGVYGGIFCGASYFPELLEITDVETVSGTTYYQLSAADGCTWPELANNVGLTDDYWLKSENVEFVETGEPCGICGKTDCTAIHFYCEICLKYDCGKDHLHCPACGEVDCAKTHTWCGLCGDYDCDIEHEVIAPDTAPIIPDAPTMTEGAEVSIVDEYGDPVTGEGFLLLEGVKSSLSAWSGLDENVFYQWQIRYDSENDLWADIQGQRGKGILLSPAMVLRIIEDQGCAAIRCIVTAGDETLTSAAIPVEVLNPGAMAAFALGSSTTEGDTSAAAEDDENKVNLIINYVFTDGKIAANPWAASLPAGVAYSTTTPITVPTIAGYTPVIDESGNHQNATLNDYQLSLNFSAEDLKNDCTVNVVYQPAPVKVVVNHHWQNVADDNYTLHETVETTAVTGTKLGDVHKSYEGFYNLLYEHPTVAADGSTVVDVYYDRYYYLMTFDLSGGYGMDAIYARYGTPIPRETMGEPTRPGYILTGWTLDGRDAAVMSTMPARNTTFVATWTPGAEVNYTIVYWKENADDNNYSYWTQVTRQATPGTKISGTDSIGSVNGINDEQYFTYNDHLTDKDVEVKGDGSTIINVYYNRNYYTLVFYYDGDCNIPEHTHDENCELELICGANGHVHNAGCQRTLICDDQVHTHTAECLTCTKPIHPEHTLADCYGLDCNKTSHNHIEDGCTLACSHTHTLNCYTSRNGLKRRSGKPNSLQGNTSADGIYTYTSNGSTRYVLKIGNYWYEDTNNTGREITLNCAHVHDDTCYTCGESQGVHTHSVAAGCYDLTCDLAIHAAHTDAAGCYKDTAHSHTESCYTYQCGLEPHVHDDTCYRACTEFAHTHGNACRYSGNGNTANYKIYRVITEKYEANISDRWPTADDITGFAYWTGTGVSSGGQSSKLHNMVANICIDDGNKFLAHYASTKYTLNYWFEHFDQTVTPDGTTYVKHNGVIYKLSDKYSQTAYYGSLSGWGYKEITGMIATAENAERSGNTFSLYYNRSRWDLRFHNVSSVIKTQADIMFEQTLANVKDSGGNLLSAFVPPYPTDSYEADTMEFEGWYTTPECFEGTKVNFSTLTMPNNDLTLYANWVPVSRTVRFFLDSADMKARVTIPDKMDALWKETHGNVSNPDSPYEKFATRDNVPNKSYIADVTTPGVSTGYEKHPYNGYTFVGWFYQDENGNEKAFDPANMPVTQDLDLYGKWSSNVLCPYEIRFVLDENGNGVLDANETTYVADPITGSTLAGNSRTFNAKGDTALYADYQSGYFPNVASHTIDFKASDEGGVVFTFLYKKGDPVCYTVRYLEKGTNKVLADPVSDPGNTKAVVTENFKPISGYMPDAYQKTLVVVPGGENEIIFYYTKDTEHALYQVNHYIENLGGGWTEYRSATFTGEIGKDYFASAETITGFTFSDDLTSQYNTEDKLNAYTNTLLPGVVSFSNTTDTVSGTLSGNGMQLNLYYTRNTYTYKVQYLEYGTNAVLHPEKTEAAVYNQFVSENAVTIQLDMDGDGQFEDFQLYEATNDPQTATIKDNETVLTFYYVRCTAEELTVTKEVTGSPSENISFSFTLSSTATDFGGENAAYTYEIDGSKYTTTVENGVLSFSLKAGQTIKFFNLPTAKYTVTERELPLGYYCDKPEHTVTLTKDAKEALTVTNEYAPAALAVKKVVNHVEEVTDNVTDFEFHITVPAGVTGPYSYTVGTEQKEATVVDGKLTITLRDGETALFANLPTGEYTVAERDYTSEGYSATYADSDGNTTDGKVTLVKGRQQTVTCTNAYPVGSLTITKTVGKAYANDEWTSDTFTFTIERTDGELKNDSYSVLSGTTKIGDAMVNADGNLVVEIAFTELGTKTIKIDNLPKGNYRVTEAENTEYTQSARTVTTSISPTDYAGKAEFTNTYKKHLGDLTITKTVTALEGFTAPDAAFSFTVSGDALTKESYNISIDGASAVCRVIDGKLTFQLKHGQTATIEDLALAEYAVTESVTDGFVLTASDGTSGTITADTVAAAIFENTYVPRGNLKITKYIDRDVYDNIQIDTEQEFTFTVTLSYPLSNEEIYTAKIYTDGTENPVIRYLALSADKELTFTLKHNQYIIIEGLPAIGYNIEETQVNGYRAPFYEDNASGTIPANGTKEVTCYNPVELAPGDLRITKIIEDTTMNNSAPKDQAFEFTVTLQYITEPREEDNKYTVVYTYDPQKGTLVEDKTGDTVTEYHYTPNGGTAVTLPATVELVPGLDAEHVFTLILCDGMTATIENLPPSAYYVTENDYSQEGFAASWTGNQKGLLGGALIDGKNPLTALTCTNTYPINTNGILIITKQVTKDYERDVLPGDTFAFTVTPTDGNELDGMYTVRISEVNNENVMVQTKTVTASNNQLVVHIPYTAEELLMGLNDSRTKILTIEGLPLGQYEVEETADEDYRQTPEGLTQSVYVGTNPGEAVFINRYKRHLGQLTISKTVEGGSADDTFIFHVKGTGENNSHIDMDVTITGSGSITIYDLPLGSYTVTEDTSWSWRYTTTDGSKEAMLTVAAPDDHTTCSFTNTYEKTNWLTHIVEMLNAFVSSSTTK